MLTGALEMTLRPRRTVTARHRAEAHSPVVDLTVTPAASRRRPDTVDLTVEHASSIARQPDASTEILNVSRSAAETHPTRGWTPSGSEFCFFCV